MVKDFAQWDHHPVQEPISFKQPYIHVRNTRTDAKRKKERKKLIEAMFFKIYSRNILAD